MLSCHKQQTLKSKICLKLAPGYYGPFGIIERVGWLTNLLLPLALHIHLVFHVSLLKKAVGNFHS